MKCPVCDERCFRLVWTNEKQRGCDACWAEANVGKFAYTVGYVPYIPEIPLEDLMVSLGADPRSLLDRVKD